MRFRERTAKFLDSFIRCKIWSSTKFIKQKLGDYLITKIIALWKNAIFHSNAQAVCGVSNNFERHCMMNDRKHWVLLFANTNITHNENNIIGKWNNRWLVSSYSIWFWVTVIQASIPLKFFSFSFFFLDGTLIFLPIRKKSSHKNSSDAAEDNLSEWATHQRLGLVELSLPIETSVFEGVFPTP